MCFVGRPDSLDDARRRTPYPSLLGERRVDVGTRGPQVRFDLRGLLRGPEPIDWVPLDRCRYQQLTVGPVLASQHASYDGDIDPGVFVDDNGTPYLLWKNDGNATGQTCYLWIQQLTSNGLGVTGNPTQLVHNDQGWEGSVVEAPAMLKHGGVYYLFYSANSYAICSYATGYATSLSPTGPFTKPRADAWYASTGSVCGPGGLDSVVDNSGNLWFTYHQWMNGTSYRAMDVNPVAWDNGAPYIYNIVATAPITPGATYTLRNVMSGYMLDDSNGANTNGNKVQQWTANSTAAQMWTFQPTGSGYCYIANVAGSNVQNMVLTDANSSTANGNPVYLYQYQGIPAQQWKVVRNADGSVEIVNRLSGAAIDMSLSTSTGTSAIQWQPSGSTTQRWYLQSTGILSIACGNSAQGSFVADTDFSGGSASSGTTTSINLSKVVNPAPTSVYQHGRKGNCTYTIPGLTPNAPYKVRLDFCEYAATGSGQRTFNVAINGTQVLTNYDIFANAGGEFIANAQTFNVNANGSGQIVIQFTTVVNNALVAGIEVTSNSVAITNGVHVLIPACAPGERLDDSGGGTTNGNLVQIWQANNLQPQNWSFANISTNHYNLAVNLGPYCLDDMGGTQGTQAAIWACNGGVNQNWAANPVVGGYQIVNGSGLCLDVNGAFSTNGTKVQSYTCNGSSAQTWFVY